MCTEVGMEVRSYAAKQGGDDMQQYNKTMLGTYMYVTLYCFVAASLLHPYILLHLFYHCA